MNTFNGKIIDTTINEENIIIQIELLDTNETRCIHLGDVELKQKLFVEDYKI